MSAFKAGRVIEAELLADRIIRDFDALMKEPDTTYRCFRNASERRQFGEANPGIGKLVWVDWRYTEVLQFRAFIHVQRRQFEQALAVLDKSIRCGPDNATAHNERGYILAQTSKSQEAMKAYEAAREASQRTGGSRSEEAAALRGIGVTWVDLGDLDKAEAALRESIAIEPASAVAQQELTFIRELRAKRTPQP
jgi:tetratricopeptide (TPR) repeat protein